MKTTTRIWLGVGAFVIAGANPSAAEGPVLDPLAKAGSVSDRALTRALQSPMQVAAAKKHKQGGEGGEGGEEGGAKAAKLPPDLDFALKIAQMRGHLLIGDELVKDGQWAAALPHFLHPSEEIYGRIRGRLKDYNAPQFASALKLLATAVKSKKAGDDYAKAWKAVEDALAAADAGVKAKQQGDGFVVESALELLKSATGEYQEAIVKGRIAKPVEYQDARGFVWQAGKLFGSVGPDLATKDADAVKAAHAAFADLKQAWPSPLPPKAAVKDLSAVLAGMSKIELQIGRFR